MIASANSGAGRHRIPVLGKEPPSAAPATARYVIAIGTALALVACAFAYFVNA